MSPSQKKILLVALAAILLLGIGVGLEFSPWFSTTQSARAPIGVFSEAPLSLEEFLGMLAARKSHPLAQRVAEEFLKDDSLRQAWDELRHSHDVEAFVRTLGRSEGFSGLMRRFGSEPGFRDLAEGLTNHPRMLRVVREFQRDSSGSARPGEVPNRPALSSLIVAPGTVSNWPSEKSRGVLLEDGDQMPQPNMIDYSLPVVAAPVGVLVDSKLLTRAKYRDATGGTGQSTAGGTDPSTPGNSGRSSMGGGKQANTALGQPSLSDQSHSKKLEIR